MSLSGNEFGGVLPNSVANLSITLSELYLGDNRISGDIPPTLENLANLIILGLEYNLLTGLIPASIGKLRKLQSLRFDWNALSGEIPPSLGNLTYLFKLYASNNKLGGGIPRDIESCRALQLVDIANNGLTGAVPREIFSLSSTLLLLDLSGNELGGSIPVEVGQLKNVIELDLSRNGLTGEIPESVRGCESVVVLDLHANFLRGNLPSALTSLKGIEYLDLSGNNLTGKIPEGFETLRFLFYLNLSFNHLQGEVPKKGVFGNASEVSLAGNPGLCGGIPRLLLPRCPDNNGESKRGKSSTSAHLRLALAIVCAAILSLAALGVVAFCWRRSTREPLSPISEIGFLSKVSYETLHKATGGFSSTMLIGTGSFGSVYKGNIFLGEQESSFAVKVLNLQKKGAEKSFLAECNALRNIRHRNLVKVLTCCSSMDFGGDEFKALVFEYMPNGSLDKWLHDEENQSRGLNLSQRLSIAIDVASATCYLHEECDRPIIHCDLKPSNVLLDGEMVAHVSDFGLARLISNSGGFSGGETSTTQIKGTIGYVPPEYSTGCEPSKEGDLYSYGILVLEMFTGRRPTDEMFKDDFNLHNFVKSALLRGLVQVAVSAALLSGETEQTTERNRLRRGTINREIEEEEARNINIADTNTISPRLSKCLVSVLEIGLACSRESPNERMSMRDVIKELQHIKNTHLRQS